MPRNQAQVKRNEERKQKIIELENEMKWYEDNLVSLNEQLNYCEFFGDCALKTCYYCVSNSIRNTTDKIKEIQEKITEIKTKTH